MATFISSFTSDEIEINFKEPYLTGSLNEKQAGVIPAGTYRGFNLTTNASALTVTVAEDTNKNDHLAVYETADGYSIRIRRTTGDFNIDLTSLTSKTVVIAIYADYTLSQTTEAEIRAYELLPTDDFNVAPEKDELVVLGTVEVPASGVISDPSITPTNRTPAWGSTAIEVREPVQIIKNGDFRIATSSTYATGGHAWPWWDQQVTETQGSIEITESDGPAVGDKHLHLWVDGVGDPSLVVRYNGFFAVVPNSKVRVAFQIKGVSVPASPTHMGLEVSIYGDGYGDLVDTWYVEDLTLSGTWAYTEIEQTINLSSDARYITLAVYYNHTAISTGDIYFDDIRMWLEQPTGLEGTVQGLAPMTQGATLTNTLDIPKINAYGGDIDYFISTMLSLAHNSGDTWHLKRRPAGTTDFILKLLAGYLEVENTVTLGANKLDSDAKSREARISTSMAADTVAEYTLMWEIDSPDYSRKWRAYGATGAGSLDTDPFVCFTVNAEWNGTQWQRDEAVDSSMYVFRHNGFIVYHYDSADTSPWDDNAWTGGAPSGYGSSSIDGDLDVTRNLTVGSDMNSTPAQAELPRVTSTVIDATAGTSYTLLWEIPVAARPALRLYAASRSGASPTNATTLVITVNALWGSTSDEWTRDVDTGDSFRWEFSHAGFYQYFMDDAELDNWSDAAWESTGVVQWEVVTDEIVARLPAIFKEQIEIGADRVSTAAEGLLPRLVTPVVPVSVSADAYTLLWHLPGDGVQAGDWRLYFEPHDDGINGSRLAFTYNAEWDSSTAEWDRDITDDSTIFSIAATSLSGNPYFSQRIHQEASSAPWNNGNWDEFVFQAEGASSGTATTLYTEDFRWYVQSHGSQGNPAASSYTKNMFCPKNMVKAWAVVRGATTNPTLTNGFNIDETSLESDGYFGTNDDIIRIPFDLAFSSDQKVCAVVSALETTGGGSDWIANPSVESGYVDVSVVDSAGAKVDLSGSLGSIHIVVLGIYDS